VPLTTCLLICKGFSTIFIGNVLEFKIDK
jgi:hypothetical protein